MSAAAQHQLPVVTSEAPSRDPVKTKALFRLACRAALRLTEEEAVALHVLEAASKQHLCLVPGCFDVPLAFAVKQTLQAEDAFCSHHHGDAVFRSQKQVQAWLEDPEDQLLGRRGMSSALGRPTPTLGAFRSRQDPSARRSCTKQVVFWALA